MALEPQGHHPRHKQESEGPLVPPAIPIRPARQELLCGNGVGDRPPVGAVPRRKQRETFWP